MWWVTEAAALESVQVHFGVELSAAIGPRPRSGAASGGPDRAGVGFGMILGAEAKYNQDALGPYGGPFVHARVGNGWRGITLGMAGGFGYTTGHRAHHHLFSMGGEAGVAFVSGLGPTFHIGARMQGLVAGQMRVTTHLLHDDYVTHDPTFAIGLVAPFFSPYASEPPLTGDSVEHVPPPQDFAEEP